MAKSLDLKEVLLAKMGDIEPLENAQQNIKRAESKVPKNLLFDSEATTFVPELVTSHSSMGLRPLSIQEAKEFDARINECVEELFVEGIDYGTIPGCKSKFLFKAGSEKILNMLGLVARTEIVDKIEDFEVGYFNSLVIHPMLNDILRVMRKYSLRDGEFLDVQLMRSSRLASQLERIISPEGTYPLWGRALSYRCGIFHLLSQAALLKILPRNISQAQVRCALTKVIQRQFEGNQNFNSEGWLICGLNGSQMEICEDNIDTGSLYACCTIFLPLGLKANDVFWESPSEEWSSQKAWNGHQIQPDQSINF